MRLPGPRPPGRPQALIDQLWKRPEPGREKEGSREKVTAVIGGAVNAALYTAITFRALEWTGEQVAAVTALTNSVLYAGIWIWRHTRPR